jgi:WD40 repeat protein
MDLREHTREVSVVRWSNTGPGSDNTSSPLVLASASLDTTVKLWDPEAGHLLAYISYLLYSSGNLLLYDNGITGKCLATLTRHNHPVTNIAFKYAPPPHMPNSMMTKCIQSMTDCLL